MQRLVHTPRAAAAAAMSVSVTRGGTARGGTTARPTRFRPHPATRVRARRGVMTGGAVASAGGSLEVDTQQAEVIPKPKTLKPTS